MVSPSRPGRIRRGRQRGWGIEWRKNSHCFSPEGNKGIRQKPGEGEVRGRKGGGQDGILPAVWELRTLTLVHFYPPA